MSNWRLHQAKLAAARIARNVVLSFGAVHGSTGQLPIGQRNAILLRHLAEPCQSVVTDLVPQAARAAMDHHADHILLQPHHAGGAFVEYMIDYLNLDEMVARA